MINKTKIICTIGPASSSVKILSSLIKKGMDVARLNFSHGDRSTHLEYIKNIRKASKLTNVFVPVMQDLQGPKIRVGKLENKSIKQKTGINISFHLDFKCCLSAPSYKFLTFYTFNKTLKCKFKTYIYCFYLYMILLLPRNK